jgi:hypothetical protein
MRLYDAFSKIRTLERDLALHTESTDVTASRKLAALLEMHLSHFSGPYK